MAQYILAVLAFSDVHTLEGHDKTIVHLKFNARVLIERKKCRKRNQCTDLNANSIWVFFAYFLRNRNTKPHKIRLRASTLSLGGKLRP